MHLLECLPQRQRMNGNHPSKCFGQQGEETWTQHRLQNLPCVPYYLLLTQALEDWVYSRLSTAWARTCAKSGAADAQWLWVGDCCMLSSTQSINLSSIPRPWALWAKGLVRVNWLCDCQKIKICWQDMLCLHIVPHIINNWKVLLCHYIQVLFQMWDQLWRNYKLKLFDSLIVHYIFFHKLNICDKICGAHIFDHILNKCGRFCVGFVIHTKGFLSAVSGSMKAKVFECHMWT